MKIKIKKGSSIWLLATWWGTDSLPTDFCSLTRTVLIVFFMISTVIFILSTWLGLIIATIAASISTGTMIWSEPLMVLLGIIGGVSIAAGIVLAVKYFCENPSENLSNARVVYQAWKDKYCPLVEKIDK